MGHTLTARQAAANRQLTNRGLLLKALYLVAITSATLGWLWLIAWTATQLL